MTNNQYNLPACLIIMDGFGLAPASEGNAISLADTPCLDYLLNYASHVSLQASGEAVGLPAGQMGNSEVGHLNIGAGRVVPQELMRINNACDSGSIEENEVLLSCFNDVKSRGSVLHFMGLLSSGGVHSNNKHLFALVRMAKRVGVKHVHIHCFMDGRDVSPTSGAGYMEELEGFLRGVCDETFNAHVASISGRYFAMDRDNRWDRVERAYEAIVLGCGTDYVCAGVRAEGAGGTADINCAACSETQHAEGFATRMPAQVIQQSYSNGKTDEFIEPVALSSEGVKDGDGVVFFNFRPDRARQLTRAFIEGSSFDSECFKRDAHPKTNFVCLTEYDATFNAAVAFPKVFPENVLADVLSGAGLAQYHIAETEKYAHVTFFFNGGVEEPKAGEVRKLIASPKVATYDLKPEMSAPEVSDTLVAAIDAREADVYIVNFANCDMVGHTGSLSAATLAVEAVDCAVSKVLAAIERKGGVALITADHGNADKMIGEDGKPFTAHTTNPVPLALVDYSGNNFSLKAKVTGASQAGESTHQDLVNTQGALCDIAPTLLDIIGIEIPQDMTGSSLLV